jgi:hypothetical protein
MKRILCLLILASSLWAAEGPSLFYSKEHQGSQPAYIQITIERDGTAEYRESVDDPDEVPLKFRLRPDEVDQMFQLAADLDHFKNPLESNLKVANLGLKTFRWINGAETSEQKFNFSMDANARLLGDWFARITETEQHLITLERTVRFDKLGVNNALLRLQVSMENNRLVAGDQFLPLLDKVAKNETYLNMARTRAADLAAYIRETAGGGQ